MPGCRGIFLALLAVLALAFPAVVRAADVNAELSSPTITLDDQAVLTVKISATQAVSDPQLPSLPDFNVYTSGRSFSTTYINGQMTSSLEYTYILIPKRIGKFAIGPIKVAISGKEYQSTPLTLQVEGSASGAQPQPGQPGKATSTSQNGDFLIEGSIDYDTVFEGQQLIYSFKAYQKRGASFMSDPVYMPPAYAGFWREDFGWKRYSRIIRGDYYVVSEMSSYLFPIKPGDVTIDPTRVAVVPDNFFNLFDQDPFSSGGMRSRLLRGGQAETLYTKAITVTVLPLPRGDRPTDFKGSVGSFTMNVDLSKTEVSLDETILLKVKISGKGNIKTISAPAIPEIDGLDIKSSGDTTFSQEAGGQVTGSRTFEFSIIPESEGPYEIPPLKWSYFDAQEKVYKTLKSDGYRIKIGAGKGGASDIYSGLMTPPGDLKVRDILTVEPLKNQLTPAAMPLILHPAFWTLPVIPIVFLAGTLIYRRRQDRLQGDVRYRRLKRAHGLARKRLAEAKQLLAAGQYDQYYGEVSKALFDYVADKFNYQAAGLTDPRVREILHENGYAESIALDFGELIQMADFARFSPAGSGSEAAQQLLEKAEEWIVSAEQKGKRGK